MKYDGDRNVNLTFSSDDDEEPPVWISHADAKHAFEIGLDYMEQNSA